MSSIICLCGRTISHRGISRHVVACPEARDARVAVLASQVAKYQDALDTSDDRPLHISRATLTSLLERAQRELGRLEGMRV